MSGKGNCYDNACAESFATREGLRRAVFEYIEVDYNRTRKHSANGYIRLRFAGWGKVISRSTVRARFGVN